MIMTQKSRFIAVEGNIGTGKSTVLPLLAEAIGFKVLQEPVDDPKFLELYKTLYQEQYSNMNFSL